MCSFSAIKAARRRTEKLALNMKGADVVSKWHSANQKVRTFYVILEFLLSLAIVYVLVVAIGQHSECSHFIRKYVNSLERLIWDYQHYFGEWIFRRDSHFEDNQTRKRNEWSVERKLPARNDTNLRPNRRTQTETRPNLLLRKSLLSTPPSIGLRGIFRIFWLFYSSGKQHWRKN